MDSKWPGKRGTHTGNRGIPVISCIMYVLFDSGSFELVGITMNEARLLERILYYCTVCL